MGFMKRILSRTVAWSNKCLVRFLWIDGFEG